MNHICHHHGCMMLPVGDGTRAIFCPQCQPNVRRPGRPLTYKRKVLTVAA